VFLRTIVSTGTAAAVTDEMITVVVSKVCVNEGTTVVTIVSWVTGCVVNTVEVAVALDTATVFAPRKHLHPCVMRG
jgi:N-methylhydantoinase B/oxoprolinase/acetone carboxylase alpha subunit